MAILRELALREQSPLFVQPRQPVLTEGEHALSNNARLRITNARASYHGEPAVRMAFNSNFDDCGTWFMRAEDIDELIMLLIEIREALLETISEKGGTPE